MYADGQTGASTQLTSLTLTKAVLQQLHNTFINIYIYFVLVKLCFVQRIDLILYLTDCDCVTPLIDSPSPSVALVQLRTLSSVSCCCLLECSNSLEYLFLNGCINFGDHKDMLYFHITWIV